MKYSEYNTNQFIAILVIVSINIAGWLFGEKISYGQHLKYYLNILINPRLGWFIFESPNLFWILVYLFSQKSFTFSVDQLAILLFTIHYVNRALIYPLRISEKSRKLPLEVVVSGFVFTFCNGFLQASSHLQGEQNTNFSLIQLLGTIIFFSGMYSNIQCDIYLKELKEKSNGTYGMPKEGLFKYSTAAHYFSEIVEWFGYFLVSQRLSSLLFVLSCIGVLSKRALTTHEAYKNKFGKDYKTKYALIPYVL